MERIANRIGCALAILLRGYISVLNKADVWILIRDLLAKTCHKSCSRASEFIFEGVASCVADCVVSVQETALSQDSAMLLLNILIHFVDGAYGQISFVGEALDLLDTVYSYITLVENGEAMKMSAGVQPWLRIGQVLYKNIFHEDVLVAKKALDFLHKNLLASRPEISHDEWLSMLDLLTARFPSVTNQSIRIKSFELLCAILLSVVPCLSRLSAADDEALADFVRAMSKCCRENLRAGRNGSVTPLFESTLEQVINVINVLTLASSSNNGENKFCSWCAEKLYFELEQVGAGGSVPVYMTLHTRGNVGGHS
jgi:hypothetical protein